MNKYEVCVVLNARLEEEERLNAIDRIKGYIERYGGTVIEPIEEWGKKRLAYEIRHMKEGYYYFIPFTGDASTPNELEQHIRIMEPVIRHLIVKPEPVRDTGNKAKAHNAQKNAFADNSEEAEA